MNSFRIRLDFLFFILNVIFHFNSGICSPQDSLRTSADTFNLNGQLSTWFNYNWNNPMPVSVGGRYLPAYDDGIRITDQNLLDFEASANISGSFSLHPFDKTNSDGILES